MITCGLLDEEEPLMVLQKLTYATDTVLDVYWLISLGDL